jgi:hypothetical protein
MPARAARGIRPHEQHFGAARWSWWLGLVLGGLLVVVGIAETVRLIRSGDGGFWFWFPTLVGGGALVVAGTLILPRSPLLGRVLTTVGALAGMLPTMWTLVVPILLGVLIVSANRAVGPMDRQATRS